jgi:arabinose-5-phosphate isomerase
MLEFARKVLETEADAIRSAISRLNDNFIKAVNAIMACKGRVVVTGIGKSGIIGKKIVATLSSTGTPSLFLHPAEAFHGDLGMITKGDVVIMLSFSGETEEILKLLPMLRRLEVMIISIVGAPESRLARASHLILDIGVNHEACPLNLAPSASTTATLALGDALALTVLKERGLEAEDFARFHPGGHLGKRLLKVKELMKSGADLPVITEGSLMKETILEISSKGLGVTLVVNDHGFLTGIITDGDLRRAMLRDREMLEKKSYLFMTKNPKTIREDELVLRGVSLMEQFTITALAVIDQDQKPVGILKIQDIIREGVI